MSLVPYSPDADDAQGISRVFQDAEEPDFPSENERFATAKFVYKPMCDEILALIQQANGNAQRNYLYNPGAEICQRGGISGSVAMADDTYQADDRWYSLIMGVNATIQRQVAFSGLLARYVMRLVAGGTTNRYGRAQILEAADSVPLRGKGVVFKLSAKAVKNAGSGTIVLRYMIGEWVGTADSVTSDIVNSWTSSTYTAGNFFIGSNLNILNVGSTTLTHGTAQDITLTATVGASANNLIVFYWTQDVPAHASDYIEIGETGLYRSSYYQRIWTPRPIQQELALCQRYCYVPGYGTNGMISGANSPFIGFGQALDNNTAAFGVVLPVAMRITPSLSLTAGQWLAIDNVVNAAMGSLSIASVSTPTMARIQGDISSGTPWTANWSLHLIGDGTGGRIMVFEAEL